MSEQALAEPDALYLSDAAIAARIGITPRSWSAIAHTLEKSGLPRRDPLFENLRYWPAVRAFLDRRHGLEAHSPSLQPDGEENWDAYHHRTRARPEKTAAQG